ncbi:MAG TPA: F0F1 ATP synthase subunit B [Verrucomicrobia bacterium]|nr:F0F1 ATP synthase subunit B [Verrucomicrobiota bacterium]HOP98801.1 F0F1 ATP synthase subunit B [Verrucomicrobiota bacterium]HPU55503.1 F0F1 ATP synthase subunit B [Verrucomicrobiota bacterium]
MNHVMFAGIIGDTARAFGVDWPHFIAQVISFSIVALLLHRFAYKPVLAALEDRRQRIAEGLENAEKIKAELKRTEQARQEVLNEANAQANRLIEEARAAAARVREQETQKAIAAAEQIVAKAREAAAADQARMLSDLKREIGRLVVQTTATVTGKVLTPEDQKRLAEEASRQVA